MRVLKNYELEEAVKIIKAGGTVAFPTETVYGLGANALNGEAVKKIYKAKGRKADNPLIVHIANEKQLFSITPPLQEDAKKLSLAFWPGPFTMILPKKNIVPNETSAGLNTIGVRMPNLSIALEFIKLAGAIAAPSANISGKPSPTMLSHVLDDLNGKIDAVIEGEKSYFGIESTVFDPSTKTLLRPGSITVEQIEKIVGKINISTSVKANEAPKSPGQKYKHYSPNAKLTVVKQHEPASLKKEPLNYSAANLIKEQLIEVTAENLFEILRDLDKKNISHAYIKYPENMAVLDRVLKAAQYNVLEI
ncbi:MAG: L-threonylcarbamoyladenylate synthase [Defluviitaleaceae bacterium]|nr:L-threonylcarbamoyladenylate synthase [Defluviitaleaceae bacterium]